MLHRNRMCPSSGQSTSLHVCGSSPLEGGFWMSSQNFAYLHHLARHTRHVGNNYSSGTGHGRFLQHRMIAFLEPILLFCLAIYHCLFWLHIVTFPDSILLLLGLVLLSAYMLFALVR